MAKQKTYFEQIRVETVKAIMEKIAAPPVAVSIAAKPVAEIAPEGKRK